MVYEGIIEGVNQRMNIDLQEMLDDSYLQECLIVEIIIQNLQHNRYVDISEIKNVLQISKWIEMACDYSRKYGIS